MEPKDTVILKWVEAWILVREEGWKSDRCEIELQAQLKYWYLFYVRKGGFAALRSK